MRRARSREPKSLEEGIIACFTAPLPQKQMIQSLRPETLELNLIKPTLTEALHPQRIKGVGVSEFEGCFQSLTDLPEFGC